MADKKKEEKIPILEDQEKLKELVREQEAKEVPRSRSTGAPGKFTLESKQYREFMAGSEEALKPHTFYEKACVFAGKRLKIGMKEKDSTKLQETLYFIGYHVTPNDVMSLSILCLLSFLILAGAFLLLNFMVAMAAMLAGLIFMVLVQRYPNYVAKIETIDTMNSMPLAITYMVIYMRTSPTLEGAVKFTLNHLPGPLGRDLKKLLWDMESGTYESMDLALEDYAAKWQNKCRNFSDAIEIIRNSQQVGVEEERLEMLDKAGEVVLKGNLETMQGFARGLRMPIMVLYMMCIVLPVMGLVIAPVMTSLLAQSMSANALIVVYDIFLPVLVYVFIKTILSKRPGSFKRADITDYPGLPGNGRMRIGKKEIPLLPISILVFFAISFPGLHMLIQSSEVVFNLGNIFKSLTVIWGLSAAIIIYTIGNSRQRLKVRNDLDKLETGLDVALYQLGDKLAMGNPIEHAMEESAGALKKGPVRDLFLRINENMAHMGMPLKAALFDKENGALRYYPSKLVDTIMEVLTESSEKGLMATSVSMRAISKYLENLKTVKNNIEELIGSTVSAMKFQAQFLTSFIAGIIIALDVLLFKILSQLGGKMSELSISSEVSTANVAGIFQNSMFNVASMVPAEHMQLIVGFYMIQVTVLLSVLINGVENGKDNIYKNYTIGINLLMATVIYTVAVIFGVVLFSSFSITG